MKSSKPELRFEGFTDEWEKKKFGDEFNFMSNNTLSRDDLSYAGGAANNLHYGDVLTKFGEYIDTEKESLPFIKDEEIAVKFQTSELKDGDIVIADTAEDYAVGKCTEVLNVKDKKIISGLHTMPCRPKDNYAPKFLGYCLNSPKYHDELIPLMQGIKVLSLSRSAIQDTEFYTPQNINEQKTIGEFLSALDNKYLAEQEKYKKLVLFKKAMMIAMFPEDGSDMPSVRFDGYSGKWEIHPIGDLLIERNEQEPMSEEYPLMAFIANEGVAPKGERYDRSSLVSDVNNKLYKKTEFGDFIYSSNNLETGSIGLNKYGSACISPVYSIFRPTDIADSDFIGRRLVRKDFINSMIKWRQGVIYGQWRIHEDDFLKIEVAVPSVEEQKEIGKFFNELDNLITSCKTVLSKLENIKKASMNKLFV